MKTQTKVILFLLIALTGFSISAMKERKKKELNDKIQQIVNEREIAKSIVLSTFNNEQNRLLAARHNDEKEVASRHQRISTQIKDVYAGKLRIPLVNTGTPPPTTEEVAEEERTISERNEKLRQNDEMRDSELMAIKDTFDKNLKPLVLKRDADLDSIQKLAESKLAGLPKTAKLPPASLGGMPIAPQDASIKIKGLYIGMDIKDVNDWFNEKFGKTNVSILEGKEKGAPKILIGTDLSLSQVRGYVKMSMEDPSFPLEAAIGQARLMTEGKITIDISEICANTNGAIDEISLTSSFVNYLFKTSDMEASEFVRQFTESYKLPKMSISDDYQTWSYTSPDGVKIIIDGEKNILIKKVENKAKVKGAFD